MTKEFVEFLSKFTLKHAELDSKAQNVPPLGQPFSEVQNESSLEQAKAWRKPKSPNEDSVLSDGVIVKGSITASSNIKIMGIIEGDVTCDGDIIVVGKVFGDIKGTNIKLQNCEVKGNIVSSHTVIQSKDSIVLGDISAIRLDVAGIVTGNLKIKESIVLQGTASIIGDIESNVMSIIEGAQVNGKIQLTKNN